jgi:hypothetical protein
VVKGEDSQLSGCGLESWHRILDGCKRSQLLQLKINETIGSQMGHTKKLKNQHYYALERNEFLTKCQFSQTEPKCTAVNHVRIFIAYFSILLVCLN